MLNFVSICPHPPIIIPTIGSPEDLAKVKNTINEMEELREEFEKKKPETIFLISPHGPVDFTNITLTQTQKLSGNFTMFNDRESSFSFENDQEICQEIKNQCKKKNIPLRMYEKSELDHGTLIPLYYLTKNYKPKVVPVAYSMIDISLHFTFGKILEKIASNSNKKIGIIASGDLSHCLTPEAPAGYTPRGKEFDEKIIDFLKKNDIKGILNMDEMLIEEAGECGYKSIVILLGALSALKTAKWKMEILSYEAPFGVGYLVANTKFENNKNGPVVQ